MVCVYVRMCTSSGTLECKVNGSNEYSAIKEVQAEEVVVAVAVGYIVVSKWLWGRRGKQLTDCYVGSTLKPCGC